VWPFDRSISLRCQHRMDGSIHGEIHLEFEIKVPVVPRVGDKISLMTDDSYEVAHVVHDWHYRQYQGIIVILKEMRDGWRTEPN
jgi:hypothetical protein